ncbi:MAG: hypothetical protein HYT43_02215 [Candidatus Taylorbacteria bacterium]|nr:hypothetical protein [Candidatus Taylorbacteria bacterium]
MLDDLRNKPEPVRKRIALLAALGLTVIIFLFYLAAAPASNEQAGAALEEDGALGRFITDAKNFLASVPERFGQILADYGL